MKLIICDPMAGYVLPFVSSTLSCTSIRMHAKGIMLNIHFIIWGNLFFRKLDFEVVPIVMENVV